MSQTLQSCLYHNSTLCWGGNCYDVTICLLLAISDKVRIVQHKQVFLASLYNKKSLLLLECDIFKKISSRQMVVTYNTCTDLADIYEIFSFL